MSNGRSSGTLSRAHIPIRHPWRQLCTSDGRTNQIRARAALPIEIKGLADTVLIGPSACMFPVTVRYLERE